MPSTQARLASSCAWGCGPDVELVDVATAGVKPAIAWGDGVTHRRARLRAFMVGVAAAACVASAGAEARSEDGDAVSNATAALVSQSDEEVLPLDPLMTRFAESEPHTDPKVRAVIHTRASAAFRDACVSVDRSCLRYLLEEREDAARWLPDSPVYWARYEAILAAVIAGSTIDDPDTLVGANFINATRHWPLRKLIDDGRLRLDELAVWIAAHRTFAAQATSLAEKMVSVATRMISA